MSKQFLVVGLGQLGSVVAENLHFLGHEVLAIDHRKDIVQALSDDLPDVDLVTADATDEDVLKELGVDQFDGAVVAIGGNAQASTLVTLALKDMGLETVVARADSPIHVRLLRKVGADRIVEPEREIGEQVARSVVSPGIMGYVDLGEDEALIEAEVPEKWVDKTLADLRLADEGLAVVAVRRKGEGGRIPKGDTKLEKGNVIVVGGPKDKLDELDLFQE
ncbi:MAG: potassium channel family protein [Rubrobacteraceae bacterium]